jgi:hypothetical protein
MTTPLGRPLSFLLLISSVLMGSLIANAQVISKTPPKSRGANEILTSFEKAARTGLSATPDIVRHPENYPRARVDSVIDGLERIALTADPEFVGSSAAAAVTIAGAAERAPPGTLDRALSLYRRSSQTAVRASVVHYMHGQKDRGRAIAFLKSIAAQDSANRDFDGAPFIAAMVLSEMTEDGRAALLDLRDRKLLRDGETAGFVNWFLRTR